MSERLFEHYGPDEIRAAVGFEDLIDPVAAALTDFSAGLGDSPVAVFAPAGSEGNVHVKSAWLPGRKIFTVKVASWFVERARRNGTPGCGVVAAFDAVTGDLLALLEDEHHLSDVRTAAAGALATRVLARRDAAVLGVLGTGPQAYLQVLAVAGERPVRQVRVWGRRPERADLVVRALSSRLPGVVVAPVATARQACEDADVVVTATASTEPLVDAGWLRPGTHVTAVGADDPAKAELSADCLTRADLLVVDSRALTLVHGDLARAGTTRDDIVELGEILAGSAPGRRHEADITICKLIGLGVQDLAAAEATLSRLHDSRPRSPRPATALDLRNRTAMTTTRHPLATTEWTKEHP